MYISTVQTDIIFTATVVASYSVTSPMDGVLPFFHKISEEGVASFRRPSRR